MMTPAMITIQDHTGIFHLHLFSILTYSINYEIIVEFIAYILGYANYSITMEYPPAI